MAGKDRGRRGVKWRTIASLGTSWMFVIMGITGLVLYIVPQGRISYWVDWRFLGLSKTDWGNIHIVTSVLFLAAGGWHLYFNWRAFLGHIRRKLAEGVRVRKELLVTTVIAALVVVSALWHVPPLGYLIDLNEMIKDSWIEDASYEPPFGHAELLSLERLCKKTSIDFNQARDELERQGIEVRSDAQTVEQIAAENAISPRDVFAVIRQFQRRAEIPSGARLTADDVLELFEGTGLGKKTVAEACAAGGDRISRCLDRLKAHGVPADPEETVREVALRAGKKPIQVMQEMLVDR